MNDIVLELHDASVTYDGRTVLTVADCSLAFILYRSSIQ